MLVATRWSHHPGKRQKVIRVLTVAEVADDGVAADADDGGVGKAPPGVVGGAVVGGMVACSSG